jgi:hypothetical protein
LVGLSSTTNPDYSLNQPVLEMNKSCHHRLWSIYVSGCLAVPQPDQLDVAQQTLWHVPQGTLHFTLILITHPCSTPPRSESKVANPSQFRFRVTCIYIFGNLIVR